jgi:hypothetical protein
MPFELLEPTPTTFLHTLLFNKIHVECHNETNMVVNVNKDKNDPKTSLTSNTKLVW